MRLLLAILSDAIITKLLLPYSTAPVPGDQGGEPGTTQALLAELVPRLSLYLDLLLHWNQRTNLTAIREPERMVQRHFGESLFAARVLAVHLRDGVHVLDIGSGAGFPGLPLQLALPAVHVTLTESQGKKAAFLREAVRVLGARAEVWAGRAQALPAGQLFGAVTMRAVDRPEQAVAEGKLRLKPGGWLLHMRGGQLVSETENILRVPGLDTGVLELTQF